MNRKTKLSLPLLLIFLLTLSFILGGCGLNNIKDPHDIIEEQYGNKEFKISFSSETLDKPLDDITYSANKIPTLPTPQKVGYIFEGWFLDSKFVVPYTDDALYLSMKDITLYPKWSKETFMHNGTYDIEFDAKIVEGTVSKGKTTDKYGGYRDFSKCINKDSCHIEKNDDELLLKIQFDGLVTTPFMSAGQVFTVRIDPRMGTEIYVKDKIDSQADSVKTLFIKIDNWDLSTTLYLNVDWTNYENKELSDRNRYDTTTSYTVAINLTKIIGFSQSFVDPDVPLEKGYYLAKSYYRTERNTESMAKTYNPVYSYIYSDGNQNYKLIKQNSPYTGLVSLLHPLYQPITDNYYDTMMAFTSCTMVFDVESRNFEGEVKSDYYPETYNGGYYRKTVTEFHADTGKFYNIIDLDKDLSKEYIALTAVSGYMERKGGMGYIRQILSVDYKNLIKLAEADYTPLSGDSYDYNDEFNFYPGNYDDLDQKNLTYDALLDNGMAIEMPNFFYSAKNMNSPLKERKIHSSRIEVVPTKQTSGFRVSESRYKIAEFIVNTKVFGYDVRSGNNLFMDRMSPQTFAGDTTNSQLRSVREVKTGKLCKNNEEIVLDKLFNEKVNRDINFSNVKYKAYEINDKTIDFNKEIKLDKKFNYTSPVAIEFEYNSPLGTVKTIVELKDETIPKINIRDNYNWIDKGNGHYTKKIINNVGDEVSYPRLNYEWGNVKGSLVENFYEDESGFVSINPAKAVIYGERSGYHKLYLPLALTDKFIIPERNIVLIYELNNEFNDKYYVYFDYISDPQREYTIIDDYGNIITKDNVKFDEETNDRKSIFYSHTGETVFDKFSERQLRNYTHIESGYEDSYELIYYNIYSNNEEKLNCKANTNENILKTINDFLIDKEYGVVSFYYYRYGDILEVNYPYKVTFAGEKDFPALDYENYFTDTRYTFGITKLIASNMTPLSKVSISMDKLIDGKPSTNWKDKEEYIAGVYDSQCVLEFHSPGVYRMCYTYRLPSSLLRNSKENYKYLSYYQDFIVDSNKTDIEITYKTDSLHPFSDGTKTGSLEKTVKYSLGEKIYFLDKKKDVFLKTNSDRDKDILNLWGTSSSINSTTYKPGNYIEGSKFIDSFNSKHITLYAIWEIRFTVECQILDEVNKVTAVLDSYHNCYVVTLPTIRSAIIPENKVFAGWTGGFLGNEILKASEAKIPYRNDYYDIDKYKDYFKVEAVFKDEFLVTFEVDDAIADLVRSEKVIDGNKLSNPAAKLPTIKDKSYRFVGYYVKGDSNETIINLNSFVVTSDVTLVAKFIKK